VMILSWFSKQTIVTEMAGNAIVVTMPGTSFKVLYTSIGKGQLVTDSFSSAKGVGEKVCDCLPKISGTRLVSRQRQGARGRVGPVAATGFNSGRGPRSEHPRAS